MSRGKLETGHIDLFLRSCTHNSETSKDLLVHNSNSNSNSNSKPFWTGRRSPWTVLRTDDRDGLLHTIMRYKVPLHAANFHFLSGLFDT